MTIGDHIRVERSKRKLLQSAVAEQIGVCAATIGNWETNKTLPPIEFMPVIIAFLGFDPTPAPVTLAERMWTYRMRGGLSIKEAASRLGVDQGMWGVWERGKVKPWVRFMRRLEDLFCQGDDADERA